MKRLTVLLGLALLLLASLTACKKSGPSEKAGAGSPATASDLSGAWAGKLAVGQVELRLQLKLAKAADGSYSATIDSLDQGAKDIPVTSVLINQPSIQLELDGIGAVFKGDLNKAQTEISGSWKQGPQAMPLIFRRTQGLEASAAPAKESYTFTKGSKPDIRGYWKGTLDVRGVKLRLAFKVARGKDGSYGASLDSLDQGAKDLPASEAKFNFPEAHLEWKLLSAAFQGKLNEDATRLSGQWTQGGQSFPLELERTETAVTALSFTDQLSFEAPAGSGSDIRGYWKGELQVDPALLRIVLKIGRASDGSFAGTMDSLDQGSKDLPMSSIEFTKPAVTLKWQGIGGSFTGKLNEGGTQMAGTFAQGGRKIPVTFDRTAQPLEK